MRELQELGLNKLESDVYLALQELGEAKVGVICKKLNLPNSHMYPTLNKLKERGLVSYKFANNVKIFKASSPDSLKQLFEEKKEELAKQEESLLSLIENLKQLPKNKETESDYQYFEGDRGVKNLIEFVYTTAPRNSEIQLLSAVSQSWEHLNAFFLDMHKVRIERNVSVKMIMQEKTKELKKHIADRQKIGLLETRVSNFSHFGELLLTEDYLCILDTSRETKTPCGFLIKNKIFVTMFKQIYDFIWSSSKKV